MKSLIVTGFEPFGGASVNPTEAVVRALQADFGKHPENYAGFTLTTRVLPVEFTAAQQEVVELVGPVGVGAGAVDAGDGAVIVNLGLAAGRTHITPERVAINVVDARIADNSGARPVDLPVVDGGPAAYFSTLPIKAMVARLNQVDARPGSEERGPLSEQRGGGEGAVAQVSNTAGTYVCNAVFYRVMHELATRGLTGREFAGVRAGFIHVPSTADMPQELIDGAVLACVQLACRFASVGTPDIVAPGGAES